MNIPKTKKVSIHKNSKKKLWHQFDAEVLHNEKNVECIYSNIGTRDVCDCCTSTLMVTDEGFQACMNKQCGIIYRDTLDQTAEWRYYGADDSSASDPTRCGMPINPLLQESSFGCKVIITGASSYEMRKIMRYTDWLGMPYKEKSQYDEFQRITIFGNQSGIPKLIIDDAMRFHKRVSEAKTFRGHNRDGIIAASIYLSARFNKFPRTAKEIAQIFHLDTASATRGCKNAVSIIERDECEMANTDKTVLCQTTPDSFIDRYCSRLNINIELTKVCKFVAIRIQRNNMIPENTPHSIAAGIVFFIAQACNINVSKRDISSISEISEVTINKCYKKLVDMTDSLIPKAILEKYT